MQSLVNTILTYQKLIKRVFLVFHLALVAFWFWGNSQIASQGLEASTLVINYGKKLGLLAVSLYVLTLIPGILVRLRVMPQLSAVLMPFRRQIGVLMFICAFIHMNFTTTLPMMASGNFDPTSLYAAPQTRFGLLAFWVLFPLFITSNDFSQKILKKRWKLLHRLTYISLFFILLHVSFFNRLVAWQIGAVTVFWALSWIMHWSRKTSTRTSPVEKAQ